MPARDAASFLRAHRVALSFVFACATSRQSAARDAKAHRFADPKLTHWPGCCWSVPCCFSLVKCQPKYRHRRHRHRRRHHFRRFRRMSTLLLHQSPLPLHFRKSLTTGASAAQTHAQTPPLGSMMGIATTAVPVQSSVAAALLAPIAPIVEPVRRDPLPRQPNHPYRLAIRHHHPPHLRHLLRHQCHHCCHRHQDSRHTAQFHRQSLRQSLLRRRRLRLHHRRLRPHRPRRPHRRNPQANCASILVNTLTTAGAKMMCSL